MTGDRASAGPTPARAAAGHRFAAACLGMAAKTLWCVEPESAAVAALLPVDAVCLDIGGEYGLYATQFSAAAPLGRTLVIEANPVLCSWLRWVRRLLRATQLDVVGRAVGSQAGRVTFEVPRRRGRAVVGRGSVATRRGPNHEEFSRFDHFDVEVVTLDAIVAAAGLDRVDVVKADIEGMEAAMLDGAGETLRRFSPTWLLEIEYRHLSKFGRAPAEVFETLLRRGYTCSVYSRGRWEPTVGPVPGVRNYLFTPDRTGTAVADHCLTRDRSEEGPRTRACSGPRPPTTGRPGGRGSTSRPR